MRGKGGTLTWDLGLLILRLGLGGSFIFVHGGPKLLGGSEKWRTIGTFGLSPLGIEFQPAAWGFAAGLFELLGGLGLLLGLFFVPATVMILLVMIAATAAHINANELMHAAYPFELGIVMIALMFLGPGRLSLGRIRTARKRRAAQAERERSAGAASG